jgi:hypothetical protein
VIVVPGLLLPKGARQTVGSIDSFRVAVMVSKNWKDWTRWQEVLELLIYAHFRVLGVRSGQLGDLCQGLIPGSSHWKYLILSIVAH